MEEKRKMNYSEAELEIIRLKATDLIQTSGDVADDDWT